MTGHLIRSALICGLLAVLFADVVIHDVLGIPRRRRG